MSPVQVRLNAYGEGQMLCSKEDCRSPKLHIFSVQQRVATLKTEPSEQNEHGYSIPERNKSITPERQRAMLLKYSRQVSRAVMGGSHKLRKIDSEVRRRQKQLLNFLEQSQFQYASSSLQRQNTDVPVAAPHSKQRGEDEEEKENRHIRHQRQKSSGLEFTRQSKSALSQYTNVQQSMLHSGDLEKPVSLFNAQKQLQPLPYQSQFDSSFDTPFKKNNIARNALDISPLQQQQHHHQAMYDHMISNEKREMLEQIGLSEIDAETRQAVETTLDLLLDSDADTEGAANSLVTVKDNNKNSQIKVLRTKLASEKSFAFKPVNHSSNTVNPSENKHRIVNPTTPLEVRQADAKKQQNYRFSSQKRSQRANTEVTKSQDITIFPPFDSRAIDYQRRNLNYQSNYVKTLLKDTIYREGTVKINKL